MPVPIFFSILNRRLRAYLISRGSWYIIMLKMLLLSNNMSIIWTKILHESNFYLNCQGFHLICKQFFSLFQELTKTKERWRQQIRKIQVIGVIGFKKTLALWDIWLWGHRLNQSNLCRGVTWWPNGETFFPKVLGLETIW